MKALSLTQPWAQLVVWGQKQFETRSWRTAHRGPIAIHASKSFPKWAREFCDDEHFFEVLGSNWAESAPLGAIVGIVSVISCLPTEVVIEQTISMDEQAFGDWSPGRYAWGLNGPLWLIDPIPVRGMLGLWTLPQDVEGRLTVKLSHHRHPTENVR